MSETATPAAAEDIRPLVRTGGAGNRNLWIFGAVLLLGGFLLFQTLNARRHDLAQPDLPTTAGGTIAAPPPLTLPPDYAAAATEQWPVLRRARLAPTQSAAASAPAPQVVTRVVERMVPMPQPGGVAQQLPVFAPQPSVVFAAPTAPLPAALAPAQEGGERVQASRLVNPALTVPKGTVIPAVLETALDSTRAGGARALVSRDVRSFDGSRVLIPRGSRLYGEYAADMSAGQRRALVRWQRLLRPDGVLIELDSPSADALGRAGIGGKVNTHFFERFGGAILQSILDIGVNLATREVSNDTVVVALPNSVPNVANTGADIPPTLKVQQGSSVSVFVARDLDFSTVDR